MARIWLSNLTILACWIIFVYAQGTPQANIKGRTRDCFAGRQFRPAGVDIYLVDPYKSPLIEARLKEMDRLRAQGGKEIQAFFDSYNQLSNEIKKNDALVHVVSDKSGTFLFSGLSSGRRLLVLGLSEREDDPAYYTYREVRSLRPGENFVVLDFSDGAPCTAKSTVENTPRGSSYAVRIETHFSTEYSRSALEG